MSKVGCPNATLASAIPEVLVKVFYPGDSYDFAVPRLDLLKGLAYASLRKEKPWTTWRHFRRLHGERIKGGNERAGDTRRSHGDWPLPIAMESAAKVVLSAPSAESLGITTLTLGRWLEEPASPTFHEVEVRSIAQSAYPVDGLRILLPSGLAIEGLNLGQVVELARLLP